MIKLFSHWELSLDLHQWIIGWNYYGSTTFHNGWFFNLFLGPLRLGRNPYSWKEVLTTPPENPDTPNPVTPQYPSNQR